MKKIYTIGRDEGCDIVIPDNTDIISRLHATIRVESNGKIFLTDQSRNGTYVNGMKMSSNVEIPVSRKDVVSFAHIYNLDWSLIPFQKKNTLRTMLVVVMSLAVLTGIALGTKYLYDNNRQVAPVEPQPIAEPPTVIPEPEPDTVIVRDTVVVKPEAPVAPKQEIKDTIKANKTKEEIYDPIY